MPTRCLLLALCLFGPLAVAQDAVMIRKNLDDANTAFRRQQYDEASLCLKALFKLDPHHQQAHLLAVDICLKQTKPEMALEHALRAFDAPKAGDKEAGGRTQAAARKIRTMSPRLADFLVLRAAAADQVLALRKRAEKAKSQADVSWLVAQAARVAPTHQPVEELTGRAVPRVHSFKVKPAQAALLDNADDWTLVGHTKESGIKDGLLSLAKQGDGRMSDARYMGSEMADSFELNLQVRYTHEPGCQNHASILFADSQKDEDVTMLHSIAIFGIVQRAVRLYYTNPKVDKAWRFLGAAALAEGAMVPGEWNEIRVNYEAGQRDLTVRIGGKVALAKALAPAEPMGRWLRIAVGAGVMVEAKGVTAVLKPKPDEPGKPGEQK